MRIRGSGRRGESNVGRVMVLGLLLAGSSMLCGNGCPTPPNTNESLPGRGTIRIEPHPAGIQAPWYLTRTDSRSDHYWEGTGADSLSGLHEGRYTISWGEVEGYEIYSGVEESQSLYDFVTITFEVNYEPPRRDIIVEVEPIGLEAPWSVTGPFSYYEFGSGDERLEDAYPGDYTIHWSGVTGYVTPPDSTAAHGYDGDLVFLGVYVPE